MGKAGATIEIMANNSCLYMADHKYCAQASGWFDQCIFNLWMDTLRAPICEGKPKTLLIMDCFLVHQMDWWFHSQSDLIVMPISTGSGNGT
jgi:hypothetical protein